MEKTKNNPFDSTLLLELGSSGKKYYSINHLNDPRVKKLPISIKVLLECAIRNCDGFNITKQDVENILNWKKTSTQSTEIPFKPARILLQDLTGAPLIVDLAAMRDASSKIGADPSIINPECSVDLVVDHSIQVDSYGQPTSLQQNEKIEFERNYERFQFLKWGQKAFKNLRIVPPGFGICHQVNLQFLATSVGEKDGVLHPDSCIGTDSHTPMVNGVGVVGWGVGGIQAEAVMLGQCTGMLLPQVVGFKLVGKFNKLATATDLVLKCTNMLRKRGVVNKFVQFFGPGVAQLTVADRATISNMAPQYGATIGLFPTDNRTLTYLEQTGRSKQHIERIKQYLTSQGMFRHYENSDDDPDFSGQILELDLSTLQPSIAGPKRPQDFIQVSKVKADFQKCLVAQPGFKGFGVPAENVKGIVNVTLDGKQYQLKHGSVVIAAITSCTNTSNSTVMLAAAVLARNALSKGLKVQPTVKTSLSPGSRVVSKYLEASGLIKPLEQLGFFLAGFGCMTCIGNSGELRKQIAEVLEKNSELVAASVLSGNRNFQGRVHPATKANYLASPPLVIAYALSGRVDINFQTQALGQFQGKDVFLRDIWPSKQQVEEIQSKFINPQMFIDIYSKASEGTQRWNEMPVTDSLLYSWDQKSTYFHHPPFLDGVTKQLKPISDIKDAPVLALFGDSITTDHISPAGNISLKSPAARFLKERGVAPKDFNTYGARRGNDLIMARGTFANIRIVNKLMKGKVGPQTIYFPENKQYDIFDAADKYTKENRDLIIIGGKQYGSGSSRDWAAKGPYLLGIRAVLVESFERIHKSNLIGMGILPLIFKNGQSAESHGLTGEETYSIALNNQQLKVKQDIVIKVSNGKQITARLGLDTKIELQYFKAGGILPYVFRKKIAH